MSRVNYEKKTNILYYRLIYFNGNSFFSNKLKPNVNDDHKLIVSVKSDDQHARLTKTAKYKGDVVYVKFLKIPNFQIKNSTMRELRTVNRYSLI